MGLRATPVCLLVILISLWSSIRAEHAGVVVSISDVEVAVLDSDTGTPDFHTKLNADERQSVTLSANHLQKLRLSFELTTPSKDLFSAHQVFFRLKHDNSEHLFLVKPSKKGYELLLDFLGLVEELHYLSGQYTMELLAGDPRMVNSFLWNLGSMELDLPEPPEGVAKAPALDQDISARFRPKPEITHIFRTPEKRPSTGVSYAFFVLTILPFFGFLAGLRLLNVNLSNRPTSGIPAIAGTAFHLGLAAILGLYLLFWVKLNLFTTLQILGFLGLLTMVAGYGILSHLADVSYKVKVA